MTDQSSQFPRFYVTAESPCPYLPGKMERKVFTELNGKEPSSLNDSLTLVGFRRSQDIAYRPTCESCNKCISVRVVSQAFQPSRSQRRIFNQNQDLIASIRLAKVTEEQYELLRRYLNSRHQDGGMTDMSFEEYRDMVEGSPIRTHIIEYRLASTYRSPGHYEKGQLVGVALTDRVKDGLSMVYSFFDTSEEFSKRSLGTYIILDHIVSAAEEAYPYVYLGYWVEESRKMAYKQNYQPLEYLGPSGWSRIPV